MKYAAQMPITIAVGTVVGMDDAQAFRRRFLVKPVDKKKGYYETVVPFQFKLGEVFEVEHEMPKGMVETVETKGAAAKAEFGDAKPVKAEPAAPAKTPAHR